MTVTRCQCPTWRPLGRHAAPAQRIPDPTCPIHQPTEPTPTNPERHHHR